MKGAFKVMLMIAASSIAAFSCMASAFEQQSAAVSAPRFMKQIDIQGAKHVVQVLNKSESLWQYIRAQIAKGSLQWLYVAARLQPAADGHIGEELTNSVGQALEVEPRNVLTVLSLSAFNIQVVCTSPDIDDARYSTYDKAVASLIKRESAVSKVQQKDLASVRDECLDSLERNEEPLMRYFGVRATH